MSGTMHVCGFVPPDAIWKKMKVAYEACIAAGVSVPQQVEKFFGGVPPNDLGLEITIPHYAYREGMNEGYQVEIAKLPPEVKCIRFWMSY